MVDDRPYKAGVVGSSPTVPTISGTQPDGSAHRPPQFKF
jgi:hypothetical protein